MQRPRRVGGDQVTGEHAHWLVPRREWLTFALVALATLAGTLGLLRWLAPQLLGLPLDLRLVGVSETAPAFYEGMFRAEDYTSRELILNDPYTVVRGRPGLEETAGWGPHDVLGFRNRAVPAAADVVVIGDSQSYGNNALLESNWPSRLENALPAPNAGVYSMAVGGWGAAQYVEMAVKAAAFRPQLVVVAFYTGNDPLDSFKVAFSLERFADLRPSTALDASDLPQVEFPPPPEQRWQATFADGSTMGFTPALRLASNAHNPVVDAGYAVMAAAAREITGILGPTGARALFTIIPTKELVYAERIAREGIDAPAAYRRLVQAEHEHLSALGAELAAIPGAHYVDVAAPLREAATGGAALYPADINGHPIAAGYAVIAEAVAAAAAQLVRPRPSGLLAVAVSEGSYLLYLSLPQGLWRFADGTIARSSGWQLEQAQPVTFAAIAGLPRLGVIEQPDPERFGPAALR